MATSEEIKAWEDELFAIRELMIKCANKQVSEYKKLKTKANKLKMKIVLSKCALANVL
ncbi:MAG TPA: hypothetical protein VGA80_06705 [Flavobacteriaceae bacterium]|jgi:hypothetical protein